MNKTN
jgi:Sperm-tail PG-rich repeat